MNLTDLNNVTRAASRVVAPSLISICFASAALGSSGTASGARGGEFTKLCEDTSTPADVRKTIDVLVAYINAKSCAEAEERLSKQTYFEINKKGITTISPMLLFPKLSALEVRDNAITSIEGVNKLAKLSRLEIRGNKITDLSPINGLKKLRILNAQNNSVSSISNLDDLPKLRMVNLNDNPIEDLTGLKPLPKVVALHFQKTKAGGSSIGDLAPLAVMPALKGLTLKNNLKIRNIAKLPALETLNVAGTGLKDLKEVAELSDSLKRLEISNNPLATAESIEDLKELKGLNTLNMFDTGIDDISVVANLTELTYIDLRNNKISTVAALKDLEKVTRFIFKGNPLGTTVKRTEDNCPTDAASEIIASWCQWDGDDGR